MLGRDAVAGAGNLAAASGADIVALTVPYSAQQATENEVRAALEGTYVQAFHGIAHLHRSVVGRNGASLQEFVAQARAAEAGGAGTMWVACRLFLRDPIAAAHAALAATSRIRVALIPPPRE